nr:MAG: HAMP domain-containing histidine kinase [Hyphomicrobiales bacterium]
MSARPAESPASSRDIESDLRSLQVVLSADGIRDVALSSPLWALIMAFIFGGLLPELGVRPALDAWPWIALCTGVGAVVFGVWRSVKSRARAGKLNGTFQMWVVALGCFAVGGTWSLIVPIFWIPENALNHCFLLVVIMGSVSLLMTSKSGKFVMNVAATLPNICMICWYFMSEASPFDLAMSIIVPIWAVQLYIDTWRSARTVLAAHRTNLAMELVVADLAAARDEASRASEAKSTFLANMSHELRTPLNAIMAFSEVIATEALGRDAQDRYRQYAKDVLSSGQHLLGLVNDLLDLAKIESGKLVLTPKWLDGAVLLNDCTRILNDIARKKNISLRTMCPPAGSNIFADERALKQIAINLLSNAVKFTPVGGHVVASLDANDAGITLCIRDNGRGIPADQLARIVQPFEQLDNRYGLANGGTGLGLALVKALTELQGGKFDIESEVGCGTAVTIWLPRANSDEIMLPATNEQIAA